MKWATLFFLWVLFMFFVAHAFEIVPIATNTIQYIKEIFLTASGDNQSPLGIRLDGSNEWGITITNLTSALVLGTDSNGKIIASTSGSIYGLISWFAISGITGAQWATWAQGIQWVTWAAGINGATWAQWATWASGGGGGSQMLSLLSGTLSISSGSNNSVNLLALGPWEYGSGTLSAQIMNANNHAIGKYSVVGWRDNSGPGTGSFIGGGSGNTTSGEYSSIGGGKGNSIWGNNVILLGWWSFGISGNYSSIVGWLENTISGGLSFIGWWQGNTTSGDYSFIGGWLGNNALGILSVVVGGGYLPSWFTGDLMFYNVALGNLSFIGNGILNHVGGSLDSLQHRSQSHQPGEIAYASGDYSSIVGGWENFLVWNRSFIGGGFMNYLIWDYSFIGMGNQQGLLGNYSFIGGWSNILVGTGSAIVGGFNRIFGDDNFIGGGLNNRIGVGTGSVLRTAIASENYSSIVGGRNNVIAGDNNFIGGWWSSGSNVGNTISGSYSFIGGWWSSGGTTTGNIIIGNYSVIPGGSNNIVSGNNSFAAGNNAHANHDNTFVWNAWAGTFSSTAIGQFDINARVVIGSAVPSTTGAMLTVAWGINAIDVWGTGVIPGTDPCGGADYPKWTMFYTNSSTGYYCFCNGLWSPRKLKDPGTSCR